MKKLLRHGMPRDDGGKLWITVGVRLLRRGVICNDDEGAPAGSSPGRLTTCLHKSSRS